MNVVVCIRIIMITFSTVMLSSKQQTGSLSSIIIIIFCLLIVVFKWVLPAGIAF